MKNTQFIDGQETHHEELATTKQTDHNEELVSLKSKDEDSLSYGNGKKRNSSTANGKIKIGKYSEDQLDGASLEVFYDRHISRNLMMVSTTSATSTARNRRPRPSAANNQPRCGINGVIDRRLAEDATIDTSNA
jgi:hypothetical protein